VYYIFDLDYRGQLNAKSDDDDVDVPGGESVSIAQFELSLCVCF